MEESDEGRDQVDKDKLDQQEPKIMHMAQLDILGHSETLLKGKEANSKKLNLSKLNKNHEEKDYCLRESLIILNDWADYSLLKDSGIDTFLKAQFEILEFIEISIRGFLTQKEYNSKKTLFR